MQFAKKLERIVRKYAKCGFDPIGGLEVYEREIYVERMKINLQICADEFTDTLFEELLKKGFNMNDLTGTVIEELLITRVKQALITDLKRIYFFGNKASNDPNFDQTDGLWTVHLPALVSAGDVPYHNTNSGTPLSAGDGFEILKSVIRNANNELKALPKAIKKIYVTSSVYDALSDDITDGAGGDLGLVKTIEGIEKMMYDGIEVVPQYSWDEIMTTDIGSPDSHLVLYTAPENLVIATDLLNASSDLDIWYDKKDEHVYVKTKFKFGSNYVHPSLMSVGY